MHGALMVAAVIVGGGGCTATAVRTAQPASGALPDAENAPAAQPSWLPWFCSSFGNGEAGFCDRTLLGCAVARRNLISTQKSANEHISDCEPQYDVECFEAQNLQNGIAETICHPTLAICLSHIDYWRNNRSEEKRVVSDCRLVSSRSDATSAPASREELARWWCLSFDGDRLGSCDRSRQSCEDSRSFLLSRSPSKPVSECTPQPTAVCIDFATPDGGRRSKCTPNEAICRAVADLSKDESSLDTRVPSNCYVKN